MALQLGDVRWREGEIVVRGKGQVHDRLPLLPDIGEALAIYIQRLTPIMWIITVADAYSAPECLRHSRAAPCALCVLDSKVYVLRCGRKRHERGHTRDALFAPSSAHDFRRLPGFPESSGLL